MPVNLPQFNPFTYEEEERPLLSDYDGSEREGDASSASATTSTSHIGAKVLKKGGKLAVSQVLSHLVPGSSGLTQVPALFKTERHRERLLEIQTELAKRGCDGAGASIDKPCAGLLAFVLHQKERKEYRAIVSAVPVLGTVTTGVSAVHGAAKRLEGTAGGDRKHIARLLVDHACGGCIIAGAVFVEIVVGNFRNNDYWKRGLDLLAGPYAVDKAAERMKVA